MSLRFAGVLRVLMEDVLPTIAELSVALAGFSGIVVAISREQSNVTRNILVSMIFLSLIVATFSLLPMIASLYKPDGKIDWRVQHGLLSIAMLMYFFYARARVRRDRSGIINTIWQPLRFLGLSTATTYIVVVVVNTLAVFELFLESGVAIYTTSLFALLIVAGVFFLVAFLQISQSNKGT